MSVTLRKRKNSDGSISLRLDIYHNGRRFMEPLHHLKLAKPKANAIDKANNKELLLQAEAIRVQRAAELEANNYNIESEAGKKVNVLVWMKKFVETYNKKDIRAVTGAYKRFSDFLHKNKLQGLTFGNFTHHIVEDFIPYLEEHGKGEGAQSYYNRFKRMVKQAYRKRLLKENILDFVERKPKGKAKKKDVLSLDEIKKLAATPIQSPEVRKAFLFCAFTGLRWCDVKSLTWQDINFETNNLSISQSKTDEPVEIPLNSTALKIVLELEQPKDKSQRVFTLPSADGANKTVSKWVIRAGIKKHITWHNARHTFGTNLILTKTDLLTTSKLLGHTTVRHTQRYVDTAAELKKEATDKLNVDI